MAAPIIIGIAGGSGSGKTWLARAALDRLGRDKATLLSQDWYYRDLSALDPEAAARTNFDHPDAIEFELLERHLDELAAGRPIDAPQYGFSTFSRLRETRRVEPAPLIVLEGLFVLHQPGIRRRLDLAVFVDTPAEARLARRIERDQAERGYSVERIREFWANGAAPMHERFVEPSRIHADLAWLSLEDTAFVSAFLADLEDRLASHGD